MPLLTPASSAARFNEFAFRRYENVIAEVVRKFPTEVVVEFTDLAAETFIHRIRDAARGFNTFRYPSSIDYARFSEVWPQVEVYHTTVRGEPACRIGLPKKHAELAALVTQTSSPDETVYVCPNEDCLRAFLTLSVHSTFKSPIRLTGIPESLHPYLLHQRYLSDYPQSSVEPHPTGNGFILF